MNELIPTHLPWQQSLWHRLQQTRLQQRLPHAMLLIGPEGVGKADFAHALAHSLLCTSPKEDGQSCGHCRHCQLLLAGNHPDLQLISPEQDSKSGEIKVDLDKVSIVSGIGGALSPPPIMPPLLFRSRR